jgi:hypothetical protein
MLQVLPRLDLTENVRYNYLGQLVSKSCPNRI